MIRSSGLLVILAGLWLCLSGIFEPLMVFLGFASCVFVVAITLRMDVIDHEGHVLQIRFWRYIPYWFWTIWQILKSNIEISILILSPRLQISPAIKRFKVLQKSDVGLVIHANCITLTPGTIAIEVYDEEGEIEVHAIRRELLHDLEGGEMDRRVAQIELPAAEEQPDV